MNQHQVANAEAQRG
ncbi:hypothetical protein BCIN_15g02850 [Botrytis cinerea B05.10]|nr:hypothetical protein BCIN_15g02850 [Botrytis cinerea B05.10]